MTPSRQYRPLTDPATIEDVLNGDAATLTAIGDMRHEMNHRFDKVDARFDKVDARFDRVDAQLTEMKSEITGMKSEITGVKSDISDLKTGLSELTALVKADIASRKAL